MPKSPIPESAATDERDFSKLFDSLFVESYSLKSGNKNNWHLIVVLHKLNCSVYISGTLGAIVMSTFNAVIEPIDHD